MDFSKTKQNIHSGMEEVAAFLNIEFTIDLIILWNFYYIVFSFICQGRGFFKILPVKTIAEFLSCIANFVGCSLLNHPLCETIPWGFLFTWFPTSSRGWWNCYGAVFSRSRHKINKRVFGHRNFQNQTWYESEHLIYLL